jgi:multisubunit Na+/H+ antiporter MnhC subunit
MMILMIVAAIVIGVGETAAAIVVTVRQLRRSGPLG